MVPPPQLKLEDEFRHQWKPSASQSSQAAIRHHGFPFPFYPFPSHFLPPSGYSPPPASPTPGRRISESFSHEPPSSDGFNPEDTPTLYPKTRDWLQSLDSTERGADGQNWEQYAGALEANGYMRLVQVAEEGRGTEGAKELSRFCIGMPIGIAQSFVKYAIADCDKILKQERRSYKKRRLE